MQLISYSFSVFNKKLNGGKLSDRIVSYKISMNHAIFVLNSMASKP